MSSSRSGSWHGLGFDVFVNQINEQGEIVAHRPFTTRFLFLAAGSVGSTMLLVRAKARGTLPRLNNQVGQNWTGNGDFVVGRSGLPATNPGTGGPAGHFILENLTNPFSPSSITELVTPPHLAVLSGHIVICWYGAASTNWLVDL